MQPPICLHRKPFRNCERLFWNSRKAKRRWSPALKRVLPSFDRRGQSYDFPVRPEVKDVTGAGDTVLAMLAYALANQLSYDEAAQLCNAAASIAP